MSPRPTTFRFTEDELELIDAAAEYKSHTTGLRHSRADLLRTLLRRAEPPKDLEPGSARWRRAYDRVFGGHGR